jgi:hypothetical protein
MVVMWLLVRQRLQEGASLKSAVVELFCGLPASFWPRPCKRIRQWLDQGKLPSLNTGAYNQARQALPLSVVEQSCDRIFNELIARMDPSPSGAERRTFLLDGSSIRTAHSPSLCQSYPPGSNQHGEGHWPLLRILAAHDLHTGLAMRPEWGPMTGPDAVSEQLLVDRAISRLPSESRLIGDANFGVFSVAYAAQQTGHPMVLRLTAARAKRLAGEALREGIDRPVVWKPTREDRRSHPDLPEDACVSGRIIVRQVQPNNGDSPFLLSLFTNEQSTPQEFLDLYTQRWNIETDLRVLKSSLCLEHLTSMTPDMVAKEIDMAMAAYNLVRAVIGLASQRSGIAPRGYSFTYVRLIIEAFGPKVTQARTPEERQRAFDQLMQMVEKATLPKRKRRSYPRVAWKRGSTFPSHKS